MSAMFVLTSAVDAVSWGDDSTPIPISSGNMIS